MYEPYFKWFWFKDDKIMKHLLQIFMNSQGGAKNTPGGALLSFRKDQIETM